MRPETIRGEERYRKAQRTLERENRQKAQQVTVPRKPPRYYNKRLDIQEIIDHLTAPDQSRLDQKEGVDVDKMCDAIAHLRKASSLLRDAELAANQSEKTYG